MSKDALPLDDEEAKGVTGAELIAAERERQITDEGWTPEHDNEHTNDELIDAAVSYMCWRDRLGRRSWPWAETSRMRSLGWKPSDDQVRNLVKAGALIAAEIDRLQRARGVLA